MVRSSKDLVDQITLLSLPDPAYFARLDLKDFHMMSTHDCLAASAASTEQSRLGRSVMNEAVELLLAHQYVTSDGTGKETYQVVRGSVMGSQASGPLSNCNFTSE